MKRLLILGGLFLATPAGAQTYYCDRPGEPYIPYGGDYSEMEMAQYEVEQYVDDMREYLECLQMEIEDATSEANRVVDEWNTAVSWR